MLHLYVNSEISDYIDGIDLEVDPDIKRSIRADVMDIELSFKILPGGNLLGSEKEQEVIGSVEVIIRKENEEENNGALIVLRGLRSMPSIGMGEWAQDTAVNGMIATLQVQQWLEQQGVLNKDDPDKDQENMRVLVDVVNEKPVYRILADDEEIDLVTLKD